MFDINVTPDKRTVLFSDEGAVLDLVKTCLQVGTAGVG